jgi:hypothetical protein
MMGILALRQESETPAPATNYTYLYSKSDGKMYKKGPDGVELEVGSAPILKTVNGQSIFGTGDVVITSGVDLASIHALTLGIY